MKIILQDRDDNMVLGFLYSRVEDVQKVHEDLIEAREKWLDTDDESCLMEFLGTSWIREKYKLVIEGLNVIKI